MRYPTDFPFTRELEAWREANIDIVLTLSRPEGTDWSGKSGYVTAHCEEAVGQLNSPVALVCGMKDMMQQSREELCRLAKQAGIPVPLARHNGLRDRPLVLHRVLLSATEYQVVA